MCMRHGTPDTRGIREGGNTNTGGVSELLPPAGPRLKTCRSRLKLMMYRVRFEV